MREERSRGVSLHRGQRENQQEGTRLRAALERVQRYQKKCQPSNLSCYTPIYNYWRCFPYSGQGVLSADNVVYTCNKLSIFTANTTLTSLMLRVMCGTITHPQQDRDNMLCKIWNFFLHLSLPVASVVNCLDLHYVLTL